MRSIARLPTAEETAECTLVTVVVPLTVEVYSSINLPNKYTRVPDIPKVQM